MVCGELMGAHSHQTAAGVQVHAWLRDGKYLARGRFQGHPFGETLGGDPLHAAVRLRQILNNLDNGTFVRPTDRGKRLVSNGRGWRLTLRDLVSEFLAEKRRFRGRQTAENYRSRLAPVLTFAEKAESLKSWPLAGDIDGEFAAKLRAFLFQYTTSRNGRPGGQPKTLSVRQIINILECLRTTLHWAKSAPVRKLPADWVSPLTRDLIGQPLAKDPLRRDQLSMEMRVEIVRAMDRWQLAQLATSFVLPSRPDEIGGLLIGDVDLQKSWFRFGELMKDCNFTKARTSFVLPFAAELHPIIRACIGNRVEGPLFRNRRAFGGIQRIEPVQSLEQLRQLFDADLLRQPAEAVQAEQDRKILFRRFLRRLGGVSEDALATEFKKLLVALSLDKGISLYALRTATTTAMLRANVPHLELRYLTGHSTNDILNTYTTLDPIGAMQRYFDTIRPLLSAIADRAAAVGLIDHSRKGEADGSTP
jgi:hypothetical protein